MFGSYLVCIYHRFLELIRLCLSGALISISNRIGWELSVLVSLRCYFQVGVISSAVPTNFGTQARAIPVAG